MLKVAKQDLLCSATPAFAKAPEIEDKKIESFAHEVFGKLPPSFDTARIPFDIKHHALAVGYPEMQGIHKTSVLHVKIDLREWKWIFVSKCFGQSFRTEKEKVLSEVEHEAKPDVKGRRPK